MKVTAIIAEYNPFHNGHFFHIEETKRLTGNSYIIVIMSSSFVQRGEPACIDKFSRAKMAIKGGANLVIELPFIYSSETAELFSYGAINILNRLNIVDFLSFGFEANDLEKIIRLGEFLSFESAEYKSKLKMHLDSGLSYPISRIKALKSFFENDIVNLLNYPNNILAVEYIKSLNRLNSNIKPIGINRIGSYHSKDLGDFSSSTAIRESIKINNSLDSIKSSIKPDVFEILENFYKKYKIINTLDKYDEILRYLLIDKTDEFLSIPHGSGGLSRRIINNSDFTDNISQLINESTSKTHTRTRIQRLLVKLLTGYFLDTNEVNPPDFIRILSSDEKGLELLSMINKKSDLSILSKFSQYRQLSKSDQFILDIEKKATDIYFLPLNGKKNMDFYKSPYIEK